MVKLVSEHCIFFISLTNFFRLYYNYFIMVHTLAQDLNTILSGTSALSLFSDIGERMYFPNGIIAQSGEAKKKASFANGTIGMTVINGKPAVLPSVQKLAPSLSAAELVAYAPTAGNPNVREVWLMNMRKKNPLLQTKNTSLPVVVPGLTAGISYTADLFFDETKPLIVPNPSWDNYELIANARHNAELVRFAMFKKNAFNFQAFQNVLHEECAKRKTARVLLNFPQNPSGYTPRHDEVLAICDAIQKEAEAGAKILVISDDAYFGLNYEKENETQSLFAYLADLHENVLAIKIDGPTKEDFVWGFRCGFLTFACKNFSDAQYDALVKKLMGVIRSSVSCSSTPAQSIMLRAFQTETLDAEKNAFKQILQRRYERVRAFVNSHTSKHLTPLPFNSGYFMSFDTGAINAHNFRKNLLEKKGVGTVAIDEKTLRVAFSSIEEEKIDSVYEIIYAFADESER